MTSIAERNLVFRIIEYGLEKETFTMHDLRQDLKLSNEDMTFIKFNLWASNPKEINSNTLFACISAEAVGPIGNEVYVSSVADAGDEKCRLVPSAIFSYIDHKEVTEAKKAARIATLLAVTGIVVSIILTTVQMFYSK